MKTPGVSLSVRWGEHELNREFLALRQTRTYRVGTAAGVDFACPGAKSLALVEVDGEAVTGRNDAYERAAGRSDVRFIDLTDYRAFREVGLRGLTIEGTERPAARDRNGARNALFADLLVTTGLRLEEASHLLAAEIPVGDARAERQRRVELPAALTKGDRGRGILLPRRLLPMFDAYIAVERDAAVAKFARRRGWEAIDRPIFIYRPSFGPRALQLVGGGTMDMEVVTPDERARLVICADDGTPCEAAVLWLTEVGHPMLPNSWEAIFARASRRSMAAPMSRSLSRRGSHTPSSI